MTTRSATSVIRALSTLATSALVVSTPPFLTAAAITFASLERTPAIVLQIAPALTIRRAGTTAMVPPTIAPGIPPVATVLILEVAGKILELPPTKPVVLAEEASICQDQPVRL